MAKTLGILAGLGPLAGAHFYRRVIELTPALSDQEHLPVVLISDPEIPSRLDHLTGHGPTPLPRLIQTAERLVSAGAEVIVIPSTTTHAYYDEMAASIPVPILNLIELVAENIQASASRRIGIVATTPTCTLGLYDGAFAKRGITAVYPDPKTQHEIMAVIDGIKSGGSRLQWGERLEEAMLKPWAHDTDGILLACTETPVVYAGLTHPRFSGALFNATDILAEAAIAACQEGP
ncbi:aspartate/glutamate racemase family protein [Sulfobacillus thermosulfidooxidans]|uniref:aspartate/glutamate racemase family protein n=1 Tax=Sulfobacillus thermosulfidooxidans TaxID=28034 RepID=UPI0006B654DE|nr:amino acid racemase [Sulfobacillus thermosulfidooxidans]